MEDLLKKIEEYMSETSIPGDLVIKKFSKDAENDDGKRWSIEAGVEDGEVEGLFQGVGDSLESALTDCWKNMNS